MAIASAVSWEVAKLVGSNRPYLAPLSAILCLQATIDQSIRFSFQRIVGTAIGVILTAYLVSHLHMNGWILGLLMLGGAYIAKWLRLDETVLHQVALTILLVFTQPPTGVTCDKRNVTNDLQELKIQPNQ